MSLEHRSLEAGIQALEVQRAMLGDAVVDVMPAPVRAKLATLAAITMVLLEQILEIHPAT